MEAQQVLSLLTSAIQAVSSQEFQELQDEIKNGKHHPHSEDNLQRVIAVLNQPQIIHVLSSLRSHMTDPSWLKLLRPLLIRTPLSKDNVVRTYLQHGLSQEFIDQVLLFPSGRPLADMTEYMEFLSVDTYSYAPRHFQYVLTSYPDPYYISNSPDGILTNAFAPVIRYQRGMSGYFTSSYGQDGETKWCGTFYYYEPASPFILYAPKTLVSWNKITACLDLGIPLEQVADILYQNRRKRTTSDTYPSNVGFKVQGSSRQEQWLNVVKLYQARDLDPLVHIWIMYAAEDDLDQLLCVKAKEEGIDMIVLKYMTGLTRVVTEVLDTRDRFNSFSNIYIL